MLRNWYAVYTRPQKEKIVASIFAKKGIECFCPLINGAKNRNGKKGLSEPLFMSHVFVYMNESDISTVKSIPGVTNILYWRSKPAIIKAEEIDAMRHFTAKYINIRLVKSAVNINEGLRVKDDPIFTFSDNTVSVKYQTVKVNLPSIGYTMIAEKPVVQEEAIFHESTESNVFKTFPRRINSFFFN